MWCPRKPQPPIMRTEPRGFFGVVIGAIVGDGVEGW
jgi:LPS O-antigen subunit length determinant protein (WzzB/FepE family)